MVEVFKTNVQSENQALHVKGQLISQFPGFAINFDLDDCDRILRIEGTSICNSVIIQMLDAMGYEAEAL